MTEVQEKNLERLKRIQFLFKTIQDLGDWIGWGPCIPQEAKEDEELFDLAYDETMNHVAFVYDRIGKNLNLIAELFKQAQSECAKP